MVDRISQKDKNLFWAAILAGAVGGVLGNFLVTSFYKLFGNFTNSILADAVSFMCWLILWFATLIWVKKQIRPARIN